MSAWLDAALAGAAAAALWALQEPLDRRVFRFPYSDVALLGRLATRGPHWRPVGLAMHIANGVAAGVVFWALHAWLGGGIFRGAVVFALTEHVLTFPLTWLVDRFHPARGTPELPMLHCSWRAFAQATWRHLLFGVVLGLILVL
jgi:hypothetical protein